MVIMSKKKYESIMQQQREELGKFEKRIVALEALVQKLQDTFKKQAEIIDKLNTIAGIEAMKRGIKPKRSIEDEWFNGPEKKDDKQ